MTKGALISEEAAAVGRAERKSRREKLKADALKLVPGLIERSDETYRIGALPKATLDELHAAGFFKLLLPEAYGGPAEPDLIGAMEVGYELGKGCGSTAWVYQNNAMHNLILSFMSREAQDEFWGGGNGHRLAASGWKPRWAKCEEKDGGYMLSGHWEFNSGIANCQGIMVAAPVFDASGALKDMRQFLVMKNNYRTHDDWNPFGLRGTGSTSGSIDEPIFVPAHRSISLFALHQNAKPGEPLIVQGAKAWNTPWHRMGMFTWVPLTVSPGMLGCAQGALDAMVQRMASKATMTGERLRDSQAVQLRLAEAQIKLNMARYLVFQDALEEVESHAGRNIQPDEATRAKWRANAAYSAILAREVVNGLQYRGGASGIDRNDIVARMTCDVLAGTTHIATDWDNGGGILGKAMLGIDTSNIPNH